MYKCIHIHLTVCISIWAVFFLLLSGACRVFGVVTRLWASDQPAIRTNLFCQVPATQCCLVQSCWLRHFNGSIGGKGPSEFHVDTCEQKFTFHFQVIFAAITWERMAVNKILLVTIKEKQIPTVILSTTIKHWIHLIYNQVIPSSIFPVSHLTIFNGTI